jgi:oligoendopeptidase F
VGSAKAFEKWLLDRSELEAACGEAEADLYIAMTCHTEDKAAQEGYTRYVETIPPLLKPMTFELDKRQVALSEKFPLDARRYEVLFRTPRPRWRFSATRTCRSRPSLKSSVSNTSSSSGP